ncbi:MAG TPA: hypothetical protein VGC89_10120, partial [Pyrinomonadaceae bacterium]
MFARLIRHALIALWCAPLLFSIEPRAQAQTAQPSRLRQIMPLRAAELKDGSRVTIASDASLADYRTFNAGNRFYVLIPQAALSSAVESLSGRGFADAQQERRGEDLVLSFALEPETTASVSQKFNRLDVIFNVKGAAQAQSQQSQSQSPQQQTPVASVAITASDALPSPQQESVKAAAVKVGNIELPPEKSQPVRIPKF